MKALFVAGLTLVSLSARAEDSILKYCHSADDRAEVLMEQNGVDISMKVQDIPRKYTPQQEVAGYNILAQEGVTFIIKGQRLADFINDKSIVYKMVVSGLFQLSQFDGEYDMIHAYAGEYIAGLKCN
ncbi:hypothetical protein [Bdellovibrio svalbardensis]|uniref:Uncharacterized protein n=1 Tax=Bdellovibrio svalbardensis TaxID=2972972 RepID=A0ABT6DLA6_9BACT|nr:hypothetical protein [Bdellovibrio svalbardensis]MDG0816860.1 hypothetical protein [Bdellovibrio svalbardensis]